MGMSEYAQLPEVQANISVLPALMKTQEMFISLLSLPDTGPEAWEPILANVIGLDNTVFLVHLMVVAGLGDEALNKITPLFRHFPDGEMRYVWRQKEYTYAFQHPGRPTLDDKKLRVVGESPWKRPLDAETRDLIMLLLHGGAALNDTLPDEIKARCIIGSLLGKPEQVKEFIRNTDHLRCYSIYA